MVLEFEQREAAHKAVANAVYTASSSSADPNAGELADTKKELAKLKAEVKAAAKAAPKAAANQTYATAKGKGKGGDAEKKICFHFRDHGNCPQKDRKTVALTLTTRSCASVHWPPVGMRATSRRLLRRRVVARLAAREVARTVSPRPRLRRKPRLRARLGRSRPALCVRSLQRMAPAGRVPTVTWFTPLPLPEATR